jgi:hypothetical protein
MSSILHKIGNRIFKNRIKSIVIMHSILLILFCIFSFFALKDNNIVNHFYNGLGQISLAAIWGLLGIENLLLKRKIFSLCFFVLAFMFIYVAIQSLHLYTLKGY